MSVQDIEVAQGNAYEREPYDSSYACHDVGAWFVMGWRLVEVLEC